MVRSIIQIKVIALQGILIFFKKKDPSIERNSDVPKKNIKN